MRADSLSCFFGYSGRLVLTAFVVIALQGCKTERDADDPVVLGIPPEDAYLGVEYAYNFGAVDTDDLLDYSLTNAPSWLALEDTSNKARKGIIMRGVPGITGGGRGRDDLGVTSRINLVANDRDTFGAQPFSIEVQENELSVVTEDFAETRIEGASVREEATSDETDPPDTTCQLPFDVDTSDDDESTEDVIEGEVIRRAGEHTYNTNTYDETGAFAGTESRTARTYPILAKVSLDQPSVTTIEVAFELQSNYDPSRCDEGFSPIHQRCDHGIANDDAAIIGEDIVALGSGSSSLMGQPSYIDYQLDENGYYTKGVLTLEPGITDCFIRLEIVDDLVPEDKEIFTVALTEVRSGIAGLGNDNAGVREPMRIEDNEPTVSLQTLIGGKRDVINLNSVKEYKGVIEGDRDEPYSAKISALQGSDAIEGELADFKLQVYDDATSSWKDGDVLEFPVGVDERRFRVDTPESGDYNNPGENDRVALLGVDSSYQAGRTNFAAEIEDDELRISINEYNAIRAVGNSSGFVPTNMAIGQNGRTFIVGYDASAGDTPVIKVFDQKGDEKFDQVLFPGSVNRLSPPVVGVAEREFTESNNTVTVYEFVVAFGVEADETGGATPGEVNVVTQRWFYDTAIPDYSMLWSLWFDTSEDDYPRWVGMDGSTEAVFVMGETLGLIEPDDSVNGTFGSFVQRIDTEVDGAGINLEIAYTRKVESRSHNERVVGGGILNANPIVIGDSSGAVEGQSQLGGKDAFFYSARSVDSDIDVRQVGTSSSENLADGFFGVEQVWLIGNNPGSYRVEVVEGIRTLLRSSRNSGAGFMAGYTPAGTIMKVLNVNDEEDMSDEVLQAGVVFDDDIVSAGTTNGILTDNPDIQTNTMNDPAIFRRDRLPRYEENEDDDTGNDDIPESEKTPIIEPAQNWDQQLHVADPAVGAVEVLANYRDDEISALVRTDSGGASTWNLHLFNAEGEQLTQP